MEAAHLAVTLRRTRAEHLEHLRDSIDPSIPLLYVPYLFVRSHGLRSTRQVAEALRPSWATDGRESTGRRDRRRPQAGRSGRSSSCWRPRRSSSRAAPVAWARPPPRRRRRPWPPCGWAAVSWCSPSTRPSGWPTPSGWRASATPRRGCRDEAFDGRRREAPGRAVGGHARHQAVLGQPRAPPRAGRADGAADPREPALPERLRQVRAEPRVHRHGAALRDPRRRATTTCSWSTRLRPATPSTSSRRPARMADFFSSRFLRMLTVPYRSRLVNLASKPFYQVADRILGSQFLEDIAEFFILFQTMNAGFVERAQAVTRLLHDKRTTFMVVIDAGGGAAAGGRVLHRRPRRQGLRTWAPSCSTRCSPAYLLDEQAAAHGRAAVRGRPGARRRGSIAAVGDRAQVERVLKEIGENFRNYQVVAQREAEQRAELAAAPDVVATVPYFDTDIYDLAGLLRLADHLWSYFGGRAKAPPPRRSGMPAVGRRAASNRGGCAAFVAGSDRCRTFVACLASFLQTSSPTSRATRRRRRRRWPRSSSRPGRWAQISGMMTGPVEGRFLEFLVFALGPQLCSRSARSPATRRSRWPRRFRPAAGSSPATSTAEAHATARRSRRGAPASSTASTTASAPPSTPSPPSTGRSTSSSSTPTSRTTPTTTRPCCRSWRSSGIIAVDNTLWSGRVWTDNDHSDATVAIRAVQRPGRSDSACRLRAADRPRRRDADTKGELSGDARRAGARAHRRSIAAARPPAAPHGRVGDAGRPLLRRPVAVRASGRRSRAARPVRRPRPDPADHQPDVASRRPRRPGRRRGRAPAGRAVLGARPDRRRRDRAHATCEPSRMQCIPVRFRGRARRRPHP